MATQPIDLADIRARADDQERFTPDVTCPRCGVTPAEMLALIDVAHLADQHLRIEGDWRPLRQALNRLRIHPTR